MDKENFVEWGNSPFSERAFDAAHHGNITTAWPMLDRLEEVHAISRGLEQIFKIAQANRVQEIAWDEKDHDDESMQPPMSVNTVESLLALGEIVARSMVREVERLSQWVDKHGIAEPDPTADLASAAQAVVAQARRSTSAKTTHETEHA